MTERLEFRGILLDMDGVVLDTEKLAESCWAKAEEATGFAMPEGFYHTLIGQSMRLIKPRLAEVMDSACDIEAFLRVCNRNYDRSLEAGVPVKAGALEFLEELQSLEIPLCLVTSTFKELTGRKLQSAGLSRILPRRVTGDEVTHSKPAPDIYLRGAENLALPPAELLAIEDSENGLQAALEAGCRVIHVPDIAKVATGTQQRAHRVYRDLMAVCEAIRNGELVYLQNALTSREIPRGGP